MDSGFCSRHDPDRAAFRNTRRCVRILDKSRQTPAELMIEQGLTPERAQALDDHLQVRFDEMAEQCKAIAEKVAEFFAD